MVFVEALLGGVAIVAARQVHVWVYPWKSCPRCHGTRRNKSGDAHRDCGRCGSTGRVRRFGAPRAER